MKTAEPKVYLVASMDVRYGMGDFLADHDAMEWSESRAYTRDGDFLPEVAGRLCYMSYANPRPGGNAAYLEHIKEVGHGCYDAETEVLTDRGWVPFPEVAKLDEETRYATRAPDGRIEYQKATGKIAGVYTGPMYRVDARGVDLLVTPNHRMLVCPTTDKAGRQRADYRIMEAQELGHRSHAYIKDGDWEPVGFRRENYQWTAELLAMLGFAIGDGYVAGRRVRFHLRRPRKIAWLASLAERLGWWLWGEGDRFEVEIPGDFLPLFQAIYDADGNKQIPQEVLMLGYPEQLRGLYEGLIASDGHRGRTGVSFDTTSDRLAGQFQQLCLHIGCAANVCYRHDSERRRAGGSFGEKPLTRLSVITRELRPEVNKFEGTRGRTSWVAEWSGPIYCVEVPNGTLYVRRNGKPVWCGNSVLEHSVFSFIFTGVSRSLTHELIRHRAGLSFSQLSQRYVDESDCAFVVPPALQEEVASAVAFFERHHEEQGFADYADAHDLMDYTPDTYLAWRGMRWLAVIDNAVEEYKGWAEYLESKLAHIPDKTKRRKMAREAARSVLPNATETKIYVTGNARAWRLFLELRGSRDADAEIRRLALLILPVLQEAAPNLFGDYQVQSDPTYGESITTKYRKV